MRQFGLCAAFGLFVTVLAPAGTALADDDAPPEDVISGMLDPNANVQPLDNDDLKLHGSGVAVRSRADGSRDVIFTQDPLLASPETALGLAPPPVQFIIAPRPPERPTFTTGPTVSFSGGL